MDGWFQKAKGLAQEATKKSQELVKEAAKFSQEIAGETAKKSKVFAEEAAKRADLIKLEAAKRADHFKSLATESIANKSISSPTTSAPSSIASTPSDHDLEFYGVTQQLREFVKGLTIDTFKEFPLEDAALQRSQEQEIDHQSNVRKDLTPWQEKHALLVLSSVSEISHLRYTLCPRNMKESKFWKIYFMLVKSHVAPYESRAMQLQKAAEAEKNKSIRLQENSGTGSSEVELAAPDSSNERTAVASEHDLDAFLLGDLDGSDGEEEDDSYDDDFEKLVNSASLDSDDEKGPDKNEKKPSGSDSKSSW